MQRKITIKRVYLTAKHPKVFLLSTQDLARIHLTRLEKKTLLRVCKDVQFISKIMKKKSTWSGGIRNHNYYMLDEDFTN